MDRRLDIALVEQNLVKSRERAKEMIKQGNVKVDGIILKKPAQLVSDKNKIAIIGENLRYVGRGGLKLEKAFEVFHIDVKGKVCADIGASTGGFTDCMLQNGAKKIYAIDVGHSQLDQRLANDNRVVNLESTNIRNVDKLYFKDNIEFISIDVSFISLKLIFSKIKEILSENGEFVALIKPQFEAGKSEIGKNGIVKSAKTHKIVLANVISACSELFAVKAIDFSPISGGDGNIEYLLYVASNGISAAVDILSTVAAAFENLKGGK